MNQFSWAIKGCLRHAPVTWRDARHNRRWVTGGDRFLVIRHAGRQPYFYEYMLRWMEEEYPEQRALFDLRLLPYRVTERGPWRLLISWLQDPLRSWSPRGYKQAMRLTGDCDRLGIPIVNRVDCHENADKFEGLRRIEQAGLRTAKRCEIHELTRHPEHHGTFGPPFIIRERGGHGGRVDLVRDWSEYNRVPLDRFRDPIALEFVDVKDPRDGFCRRYRYIVAGELGVPQNMQVSEGWEARGSRCVYSDRLRMEEIEYASMPRPEHARFVAARRLLGLDFVAFDFSYDRNGQMVVWEANLYPHLHFPRDLRRQHQHAPTRLVFAIQLALYLTQAGLELPTRLRDTLRAETIGRIDTCPRPPASSGRLLPPLAA